MRVVSAACKLVDDETDQGVADDVVRQNFREEVISAFSEAFNNVAIHGYVGLPPGQVEIEVEIGRGSLTIRLRDYGNSFDFDLAPVPIFENLPEGGFGVYIIKSFMDEVKYEKGPPNVLTLRKFLRSQDRLTELPCDKSARSETQRD
jgi:serine/threonine-protein kinase RsbW